MVNTKKHYVASVKPETIYMQWLNLTVSPMFISGNLPRDSCCIRQHRKYYSWPKFLVKRGIGIPVGRCTKQSTLENHAIYTKLYLQSNSLYHKTELFDNSYYQTAYNP